MKKNLFEMMEGLKKEGFNIVSFAETKDNNFEDYKYFTIKRNGIYFYIQKETSYLLGYTITAYKYIDYNHKQQLSYPLTFWNYTELKEKIKELSNDCSEKKAIPGTRKQEVNYKINIERIKQIAGFRELNILNNITKVEMIQHDSDYMVVRFYNKNNYFDYEINQNKIVG